jgi:serine/threonine protein kinase
MDAEDTVAKSTGQANRPPKAGPHNTKAVPMALTAGARLGPYEVVGSLGAGGMGQVYEARDTRLDRRVAIKVLAFGIAADAGARARFEREARAVAALDHRHICGIYDHRSLLE